MVFPVFQSSNPKGFLLSDDRIYENNHCDNLRTKSSIKRAISVGARKKVFHSSVPVPQVTRFFPTLGALCSQKHPKNSKKRGLMFVMMQNSIKKWWLSSSFQLLPQLLACDDLVYIYICSIHFVSKGFFKNDSQHKDYMIIIAYFFRQQVSLLRILGSFFLRIRS